MEAQAILDLTNLTLTELDGVLKKYPWFSLARRELFLRMSSMGEEYRKEGIRRAAVYVFSRDGLLKEAKSVVQKQEKELELLPEEDVILQDDTVLEKEFILQDDEDVLQVETTVAPTKPKIHVVGGDYFGKEDFESLQQDGLNTIQRMKTLSPEIELEYEKEDVKEQEAFLDEEYYTETLAKIYTNQGFYKRASDVYSKLILLYPEKSTYFAALNEEIKKFL